MKEASVAQGLSVAGWGCLRGGRVLCRNLDFQVRPGRVLSVHGANGAGKSSLLRSLAGLLPWQAGQLYWQGEAVETRNARYAQSLVYLGHHSAMHDALTALENLRFSLTMMGVSWDAQRVHTALSALALAHVADTAFGRLSQGQRRRLGLARVWLSQRPLWLLDEPDNSLDTEGCERLAAMLEQHLQTGGLAVVVTHRGLQLPAGHLDTLHLDVEARQVHRRVPVEAGC